MKLKMFIYNNETKISKNKNRYIEPAVKPHLLFKAVFDGRFTKTKTFIASQDISR